MKVLYLITRAERGGAQVHVLDLLRGLRDQCDVEVAAGEEGFLLDQARQMGIPCHVLPNLVQPMQPVKDLRALWETVALLRRIRPDVLHAHTSKAGMIGRLAAWMCGVPAVFTAHTWCFAEGTSLKWKLIGAPCERFAGWLGGPIINVSEANRELALKFRIAPAARLETIHNGIPDDLPAAPAGRRGVPSVIMVARFAPQKNQAMLLDAAATIPTAFRVQFAGSGPTMETIERKARELGVAERVEFLGDRSDVARLLRAADIFALPTNWEGFPISILEAMRAGLPIVASDVGGVREAVVDGVNGFLLERGDSAGFRRALERLLTDESLRARMARESRRMFEENFTASHMFRKTFRIYRRTISARPGEVVSSGTASDEA